MEKRIITWQWGNNETHDEYTTTRGFIFGNYIDNYPAYQELVESAMADFPNLKADDIVLSKVTVSTYMKGSICVSFPLPANTRHSGYRDWDRFDFSY